ncbi:MAG: cellulase family glycosylhydrolase [Deltaproteobacteria bacterium]|nr:cellulase family glycosylhydrolase [Deltaproteobacteria bacterium]
MSRCPLPLCLCCGVLAGLGCAPTLVEDAQLLGPFTTQGSFIVDAHGGRLLLRGANLSQTAKSEPYHPAELEGEGRALVAAHGPMAIRYLTSWAAIEPDEGAYDQAYLDGMAERLGALGDDGHLVVLDLHQDLFGVGFAGANGAPRFACDESAYAAYTPESPWFRNYYDEAVQGCFDALFADEARLRQMARALRSAVDAVQAVAPNALVGVDLLNEPHPGSRAPADFDVLLARYYQIAAEELDGTGLVLLFEPNVLHNLGEATALSAAPSSASLYAPHLYPADVELGRYTDVSALAGLLADDAAEAAALGTPLVIGEYGPKLDDPAAVPFVEDALAILDESFAGAFSWDWSAASDRGLLHEGAEEVRRAELRPHARRVAGALVRHRFDPASATLEVEWADDGAIGATEIVAAGWGTPTVVELSDGGAALEGALLRVRASTQVETHRVVVSFGE